MGGFWCVEVYFIFFILGGGVGGLDEIYGWKR